MEGDFGSAMEIPPPAGEPVGQGRRFVGQGIGHGRSPERYEKYALSSDVAV